MESKYQYWLNNEWLAINAKLRHSDVAFLPATHLAAEDLKRYKQLMRPYWDALVARLIKQKNLKQVALLRERGIPQWYHEKPGPF
jgi:hypothetical protein